MAERYLGKNGIFYCVGIGPLGSCSCWEKEHHKWDDDAYDKHFFAGQKSNASWGGVNMVMRWRCTLDQDYAAKVYPYLKELANFWQDDLVFDGSRYVVVDDAIHESNSPDVNSVLSLGLLRSNLQGTLDMSAALGLDAGRREKWQHILDHLSDYPVYERDGVKVFRYTESGQDWQDGSCVVGLQHLYPADTMDLDTDPELLEIAKNTVTAHDWGWDDNNHTMTMMPGAARIGYDPETILRNMRERALAPEHAQPNLYLKYGGGRHRSLQHSHGHFAGDAAAKRSWSRPRLRQLAKVSGCLLHQPARVWRVFDLCGTEGGRRPVGAGNQRKGTDTDTGQSMARQCDASHSQQRLTDAHPR